MRKKIEHKSLLPVYTFIFGLIVTALLRQFLAASLGIHVGVLVFLTGFLAIMSVFSIQRISTKVEEHLARHNLTSTWVFDPTEASKMYAKAQEIIDQASQSILIISFHSNEENHLNFPKRRNDYFIKGIEEKLQSKIKNPQQNSFKYARIIQLSPHLIDSNGLLSSKMLIHDPQLFKHCQRVTELIQESHITNVSVDIFISSPIPSFPSVAIIDDEWVLLGFGGKPSRFRPQPEIDVMGALFIQDTEGSTVQSFKTVFEQYTLASHRVATVENLSSDFAS